MAGIGWAFGIEIQKAEGRAKKILLALSVAIFLAVLGVFKYAEFFVGISAAILNKDWVVDIAMPLGISFYTFKLIAYVADIYRGTTKAENSYRIFLLYLCNFHQSMQGPIETYAEMKPELYKRHVNVKLISDGIYRFSVGLAKKTVLADHCGEIADALIPMSSDIASSPTLGVWIGSIVYTMQIYLDFSAYTDMAIGLGQMIGFSYPENFDYPYTAVSVKDFWRRWHITLSSFFKNYVYIPLGGNRVSPKRTTINLLIVWALTGFWHGADWNFIIWGLYYFVFIVFENWRKRSGKKEWNIVLQHLYTLFVVNLGWVFFRFSDFGQLGRALQGFFGIGRRFSDITVKLTFLNNIWFLIFCALSCTPIFQNLGFAVLRMARKKRINSAVITAAKTVIMVGLLLLSVLEIVGNTFTPFLYNQF
ncbi:MAG: MBOAT family O-acyltransferase [Bilifractor sp.]